MGRGTLARLEIYGGLAALAAPLVAGDSNAALTE